MRSKPEFEISYLTGSLGEVLTFIILNDFVLSHNVSYIQ